MLVSVLYRVNDVRLTPNLLLLNLVLVLIVDIPHVGITVWILLRYDLEIVVILLRRLNRVSGQPYMQ